MPQYTLAQLAELLDVRCEGDSQVVISGLATLSSAGAGQLSFLANPKYQQALKSTTAEAVIVAAEMVALCPSHCLISANPYLTYAKASQLFIPDWSKDSGIHPTAAVSESAFVDGSAVIGANVTIEAGVRIGCNTTIGAGCFIGRDSVVGDDCLLHANVTIYHGVVIGDQTTIHSSAVIGADGFGFAPSADPKRGGWVKIAQLGGVRIGDNVDIGAGTTIDRGALDDTVIANGVILDNQIQIGHNVELGENTAIAGCSCVAGSTKIGRNCTIAGAVGIGGHLTIVDNVFITAMTMVNKSISTAGVYSSGIPVQESHRWRRNAIRFFRLDEIAKRLAALEKKLD
ncbi:MAG: UDP-3-O-(3-hydroxymyristoyl)glucosamine N-acyltransferase [Spongiibacteraceae bacterium]